ncbi:peptidoglycan-recognition protein LC-like [Drosophila ficusphila]|uniref:peptidoglycan-recognition protein LC-like n=1 Tax=Drosophila ficusphila TaxID=30025 RepID=UPI001C88EFFC|nr:peptidoglycan-recognition protein LC-like [Drosophila ficusphila]
MIIYQNSYKAFIIFKHFAPFSGSKLASPEAEPFCPCLSSKIGRWVLISVVVFVLLAAVVIIIVATTTNAFKKSPHKCKGGSDHDSRQNFRTNSSIDEDNIGGGRILRFVERRQWLAQPPQKQLPDLQHPVKLVIVMPTNSDVCSTQAQCVFRVRIRQTFDIESMHEDDIVFNFLIGGDGNVYVGRGWDYQGAHMAGYNAKSLSLGFIGSYKTNKPTDKQLSVTRLLLKIGVQLKKIEPNYELTAAGRLKPDVSQYKADALYKSFADWTHWT